MSQQMLIYIFSPFPSPSLPPLAAVSRRFHAIVVRLLRQRMSAAAPVPGHNLVLECYHPSAKTSTPYFHSEYLGTDRLDTVDMAGSAAYASEDLNLWDLSELYSRFRPVVQDEARRPRSRYPRRSSQQRHEVGAGSGTVTTVEALEADRELPSQEIHLEEGECFSQLCTLANLGKLGPRRGIYLSHVNFNESVIRVWRHWLVARAAADSNTTETAASNGTADDPAILWAGKDQDVGIRFRVAEVFDRELLWPILRQADEDLPVTYKLEYQELLVRTRRLLLAMEESEVMQTTNSGNALILFGT
jgi:hypothetical protein